MDQYRRSLQKKLHILKVQLSNEYAMSKQLKLDKQTYHYADMEMLYYIFKNVSIEDYLKYCELINCISLYINDIFLTQCQATHTFKYIRTESQLSINKLPITASLFKKFPTLTRNFVTKLHDACFNFLIYTA